MGTYMNQTEIDFLNFENDLLLTRKKLNDLIYLFSQNPQTPDNKAIYQKKIFYLETELKYMNEQFQMLKGRQTAPQTSEQHPQMQMSLQTFRVYPQTPPAAHPDQPRKDYEKLFGKSFMGIFASVLIFISLIIFATLMMPYLTDTMKLFGLYILSFGLLSAAVSVRCT